MNSRPARIIPEDIEGFTTVAGRLFTTYQTNTGPKPILIWASISKEGKQVDDGTFTSRRLVLLSVYGVDDR